MTVSNVSSVTNTTPAANASWYQQQFQDFKALASALQSGDLSGAQSAFSSWQSDLQSIAPSNAQSQVQDQPFGSNTKANSDFQALSSALQSGDISGAKQAFANLKKDVQSANGAKGAHRGHHHHRVKPQNDGDSTQSSTSTSTSTTAVDLATGTTLDAQA